MVKGNEIKKLRKKLIKKVKEKVKEKYTGKEAHIIRAINVLEDVDAVFNLLSEHCREWYSVHFPELNRIVKDNEKFLKLVSNLGHRKNFSNPKVLKCYNNKEAAAKISKKVKNSIGSEVSEESLRQIKKIAENALALKKERKELTEFIEKEMKKLMKNFSGVCGAILGAKMLNEAGSLKKLALMPSSTIQVLGAEKALFKHIRSGSRPPKYGFLFQHPMVKGASRKNKGKIARALAGKLSIAAKEDFFGKNDISKELRKDLEKRVKEVERKQKQNT